MVNSETTLLTTMRINRLAILFLTLLTATTMLAQDKKLFSLEDLNFGGKNYHKMRPENRFTTWWGDEFVHLEVENVSIIGYIKEESAGYQLITGDNVQVPLKAQGFNS